MDSSDISSMEHDVLALSSYGILDDTSTYRKYSPASKNELGAQTNP